MDSNAIQIAVRVRPFHPEKEEPFVIRAAPQPFFLGDGAFASPAKVVPNGGIRQVIDVCDDRILDFDKPELGAEAKRGQVGAKRYKNRKYIFDHVLGMEATQDDVFRRTAMPLLEGILTGYNATIFAYGATGCGKTHTISGTEGDPGVIIRTTAELFRLINETDDEYDTHIEVSMVEIYNETIRDLLSDDFPACPTGGLRLLENEKNRVTVGGVTLKRPKSVEDVMNLVLMGNSRRSTSFTAMNSQSSRSHAVLQMNVGRSSKGHDIDLAESVVRQCLTSATLSIIDLAGSERASATQNMGARMKEGANINKSLLALSSCIAALCQRPIRGVRPHVPYRNSKLTRMLKFSLGGNCRTVMIVCVSPSSRDLEDTFNTLMWADKAKNVSTKISRNTAGVEVTTAQYIVALSKKDQEVKELKATIARLEAGERKHHDKRRDLERQDIQRVIADLVRQVDAGLPNVLAGGAYRAGWDSAELLVAAMKQRLETLESQDDIAYVNSLIRQQYARFQNNAQAVEAMRVEQKSQSTIDGVLRNAATRRFGDAADTADLENLRLTVELRKAEMQRNLLETREAAYREAVQRHAVAAVNVMAVLRRVVEASCAQNDALTKMAGSGSTAGLNGVTAALAEITADSQKALDGLFKDVAGGSLPPLPRVDRLVGSTSADTPNSPFSSSSGYNLKAPLPRSPLAASSSAPTRPSVRDTPSGKRLLAATAGTAPKGKVSSPVLMSPKRRGARFKAASKAALGSPAAKPAAGTVKRGIRFAEEDEHRYLTASEDSRDAINTSSDGGEWEDEPDMPSTQRTGALAAPARKFLAPQQPRKTIVVSPLKAQGPPARMLMPGAKKRLSMMPLGGGAVRSPPVPGGIPSASSLSMGDTSATSMRPPVSRFKSTLVALDERETTSSPESGASRSSNLGTAARAPLNERTTVPGANSSFARAGSPGDVSVSGLPTSGSSVFAALSRPTQSSLGKQAGGAVSKRTSLGHMGNGMPSSVSMSDRRSSSTGPIRNERHKMRPSISGMGMGMGMRNGANESMSMASRFGNVGGLSTIAASPRPGLNGSTGSASDSSPNASPIAPPKSAYNPLGGGATRLTQPTAASLARRTSTMGLASATGAGGMHRGPRASVSMAQLRPQGPRTSILPPQGASRFR